DPERLIVGGSFLDAGQSGASRIAHFDGARWFPLGNGLTGNVAALCPFDLDGAGPAPGILLVGGAFRNAGQVQANSIAAWDGHGFSPLGGGVTGSTQRGEVDAIAV